jgi:hypothetical protein
MGPWCRMAQQHKCNCSHLTASAAQYLGQHCLARGTYHLTPASFTLAQSDWKCWSTNRQLTHRNCVSSSNCIN